MISNVLNSRTVRRAISSAPRGSSRMGRLLSLLYPRAQVFDLVGPLAPGQMYLDTADPFQSEMACGSYQRQLVEKILKLARPGDIVLTAGAQLGYMALALAKAVGPSGRVFAFEADPRITEACRRNLNLNHVETVVELYPLALGSQNGLLQMSLSSTAGQSSLAIGHHHLEYTTVEVRRGDGILNELGVERLDGILLDVEGWESHVLNGLESILAQHTPRWGVVESWDVALKAAGSSADELLTKLKAIGWEVSALDGGEARDGCDIVCTSADS